MPVYQLLADSSPCYLPVPRRSITVPNMPVSYLLTVHLIPSCPCRSITLPFIYVSHFFADRSTWYIHLFFIILPFFHMLYVLVPNLFSICFLLEHDIVCMFHAGRQLVSTVSVPLNPLPTVPQLSSTWPFDQPFFTCFRPSGCNRWNPLPSFAAI